MPGENRKRKVLRVSLSQTADSVLVHDIKNLAFRLSALLQNVEENYDDPSFKQQLMELLNDTVCRMDGIVNRFREHHQQVLIKLKLDLNHIIRQILESLPARSMKTITMDVILKDVPLIWGDPFYIHNAFHSIMMNAVDAMPQGGILGIRSDTIIRRKKEWVRIEISDTGSGMTDEFLENKLFNPFTTTKDEGLGLGLFTSHQIFTIHKGNVQVESEPGAGSKFRILLPVETNDQ